MMGPAIDDINSARVATRGPEGLQTATLVCQLAVPPKASVPASGLSSSREADPSRGGGLEFVAPRPPAAVRRASQFEVEAREAAARDVDGGRCGDGERVGGGVWSGGGEALAE